MKNHLVALKV